MTLLRITSNESFSPDLCWQSRASDTLSQSNSYYYSETRIIEIIEVRKHRMVVYCFSPKSFRDLYIYKRNRGYVTVRK